jgi:hypothetical protein
MIYHLFHQIVKRIHSGLVNIVIIFTILPWPAYGITLLQKAEDTPVKIMTNTKQQSNIRCGIWTFNASKDKKDVWIAADIENEEIKDPCGILIKFSNETQLPIISWGGYMLDVFIEQHNVSVQWKDPSLNSLVKNNNHIYLLSDIPLTGYIKPIDPSQEASVVINGLRFTQDSLMGDVISFLVKKAMSQLTPNCLIPSKTIIIHAINVSPTLSNSLELFVNGDLAGGSRTIGSALNLFWKDLVKETFKEEMQSCGKELLNKIGYPTLPAEVTAYIANILVHELVYEVGSTTLLWSYRPIQSTVNILPPHLKSPINNSKNLLGNPILFSWVSSQEDLKYKIEVLDEKGTSIKNTDWQEDNTWNLNGLTAGRYFWHAKARNSDNLESKWSDTWSFIIPGAQQTGPTGSKITPLNSPTLSKPRNRASLPESTEVTLIWSSISEAKQYKVEVWGGPYQLMVPCDWQSGTSCHIGRMSPGTMSWHVKARDSNEQESDWSKAWSFTIQPISRGATDTPQPKQPSFQAPSLWEPCIDEIVFQSTDITFTWFEVPGGIQYKVEVWGGPYQLMVPCDWQSGISCYIGRMSPGTMSWHVKARNSNGQESDWSETWTFTVKQQPQVPTILSEPTQQPQVPTILSEPTQQPQVPTPPPEPLIQPSVQVP